MLTESASGKKLDSWISDDALSRLYENFLREYFKTHHPELHPGSRIIVWDRQPSANDVSLLPSMKSDVHLSTGASTLIIDAKYYSQTLQKSTFGKETIHSANLYQIFTYVKNAARQTSGPVSGLLLYAKTDSPMQPYLDEVFGGNRIGVRTLDLSLPWCFLRHELEALTTWLDS
ncbi:hypothetical protein [uncultured Corynebacterium sp.]|uniref:5-methylcytosine restriction system specificity protein McrC n=1 Tax=uncultured Corynebacterium sp. TaxID=159447 RepID=UPI0025F0AA88|nr:hypothetical protein [uncultured Corynebacterium sp.]